MTWKLIFQILINEFQTEKETHWTKNLNIQIKYEANVKNLCKQASNSSVRLHDMWKVIKNVIKAFKKTVSYFCKFKSPTSQ